MDVEAQRGGNNDCSDATWFWDVIERGKEEFQRDGSARNFYSFFKNLKVSFGLDGGFQNPTHGTALEFDVFQIQHSHFKVQ